jgi:lysophospholipase L1-like esterase
MVSPEPPIRYYRAQSKRRAALVVVAAFLGVAAIGTGAAWGLGRLGDGSSRDVVNVGGAPGGLTPISDASGNTIDIGAPVDRDIDATSMAMVGDSITEGSTAAMRYVLTAEGFHDLTIDGVTSRRIEEGTGKGGSPLSGIKTLYGLLADGTKADVWVIALGTNDVGQYDDPAEYRRLITTMVDMVPDDAPLVWVDVYRFDHLEATNQYNAILRDVVGNRHDSVVVSWFEHASNPDEHILRSDQVHPNDAGTVVFANLVADGIAAVA